jgi:hypothetical protein
MIKLSTRGSGDSLTVRTDGLRLHSLPELEAPVAAPDLIDSAKAFLVFVSEYLLKGKRLINPGETLAYGYWMTRFESVAPEFLEVWEYNPEATEFVRGATLTLTYWREQNALCKKYDADFTLPARIG